MVGAWRCPVRNCQGSRTKTREKTSLDQSFHDNGKSWLCGGSPAAPWHPGLGIKMDSRIHQRQIGECDGSCWRGSCCPDSVVRGRIRRGWRDGEKWGSQESGETKDLGHQGVHWDQGYSAGWVSSRRRNQVMEFKISQMDSPGSQNSRLRIW